VGATKKGRLVRNGPRGLARRSGQSSDSSSMACSNCASSAGWRGMASRSARRPLSASVRPSSAATCPGRVAPIAVVAC
jgi:hypothetical protein